jgi:hypothetical protein
MDDTGPMTGQQPEPEEEAAPVAEDLAQSAVVDGESAAEEVSDFAGEDAPGDAAEAEVVADPAVTDAASMEPGEAAAADGPLLEALAPEEAPTAEQIPAAEEAASQEPPEQLSLEEMVESLKGDEPELGEAPADGAEAAEAAVPVPVAVAAVEPLPEDGFARDLLSARLPFGVYIGAWAIFAGVMTYLLWPAATGPFTGTRLYAYFVLGGAALTLVGPLLGLGVWLAVRGRAGDGGDAGLARAAFMRAAAATIAGGLLWWIGLVLLDLHRAGTLG